MDYTKDNFVLVINAEYPGGYRIADKHDRGMVALIETTEAASNIIVSLLDQGVKVYTTEEEYHAEVRSLTSEERLFKSLEFWENNIPEEEWTEMVRELIKKKYNK